MTMASSQYDFTFEMMTDAVNRLDNCMKRLVSTHKDMKKAVSKCSRKCLAVAELQLEARIAVCRAKKLVNLAHRQQSCRDSQPCSHFEKMHIPVTESSSPCSTSCNAPCSAMVTGVHLAQQSERENFYPFVSMAPCRRCNRGLGIEGRICVMCKEDEKNEPHNENCGEMMNCNDAQDSTGENDGFDEPENQNKTIDQGGAGEDFLHRLEEIQRMVTKIAEATEIFENVMKNDDFRPENNTLKLDADGMSKFLDVKSKIGFVRDMVSKIDKK